MYILTTISRDDLPRLAQIQRFLQMDRHGQYVIRQRGQSSLSPPRIGDRFKVKIDRTSFLWLQGERTRSKRGGARAEINHRCICSDPYGGGTQFPPTGDYYMVDSTLRKGDHGRFRSPYVSRQHNGNYVTPHSPYLEGGEPPLQGSATQLQYARDTTIFTPELQKALQIIITVLKVAIGVGSVVVTFGAGGDTVVKSIVATINSGLFYLNLIQVTTTLATQSTYLSDLLKINFVEGPEKVKQETLVIIQRMVSDGNEAQIDPICEILASMLSSIAMVVGDWISTFIPDDAGLVGVAVTTIINQVSKHAFSLLSSVFDKIPTIFQDLFKHPEKLQKFLIGIVRDLEKGLRQKGPTTDEMTLSATIGRLKKIGQHYLPGAQLAEKYGLDDAMFDVLFKVIKDYFEPNIERAVYVVGQVMPLVFVILTFNEICEKGLPESIVRPVKN